MLLKHSNTGWDVYHIFSETAVKIIHQACANKKKNTTLVTTVLLLIKSQHKLMNDEVTSLHNRCTPFYNRVSLISVTESTSCCNCSGLWQDWQERCHRQSVCGLEQHRHRDPSLVRHAGQSKETHRSVARAQARRRSGGPAGCSEKIEQPKTPKSIRVVLFTQCV